MWSTSSFNRLVPLVPADYGSVERCRKVADESGQTLSPVSAVVAVAVLPVPTAGPEPVIELDMGTILVVDDNAAVARMLARFLETKGHQAVIAHSGAEALAAAAAQPPPDLILLDLSMPEMDGLEVLRRLRARESRPAPAAEGPAAEGPAATAGDPSSPPGPPPLPEARPIPPVIFFSAVDDPATIASALKHGAREYWVKASFKFDDLPRAIERYVPGHKS